MENQRSFHERRAYESVDDGGLSYITFKNNTKLQIYILKNTYINIYHVQQKCTTDFSTEI